jgi:hypothetical protein
MIKANVKQTLLKMTNTLNMRNDLIDEKQTESFQLP